MRLLARTWNVAHGRTQPETRRGRLEEMIRFVAGDAADIVLLQELPVSALPLLKHWSGMHAFGVVAMPPRAGAVGRWVTYADPKRLRSAFTGQANAVLLGPALKALGPSAILALNPQYVRAHVGDDLGLERAELSRWARNRRVCQVIRTSVGGTTIVIANMHLTHFDTTLAEAELRRAEVFASELAGPTTPTMLGGDLNIPGDVAHVFERLNLAGYTRQAEGIDHLLGKRMTLLRGPAKLADSVRGHDGLTLSDHPIVEAVFEVAA